MSGTHLKETRTWTIPGIETHTITVEWNRRRWTPPESVVRVDGEVVSKATFWIRHFYYGIHAFRLNDVSDRQIVLKYNGRNGYSLFLNGQKVSSTDERESADVASKEEVPI